MRKKKVMLKYVSFRNEKVVASLWNNFEEDFVWYFNIPVAMDMTCTKGKAVVY